MKADSKSAKSPKPKTIARSQKPAIDVGDNDSAAAASAAGAAAAAAAAAALAAANELASSVPDPHATLDPGAETDTFEDPPADASTNREIENEADAEVDAKAKPEPDGASQFENQEIAA